MALYMETERFVRACTKAVEKCAKFPDAQTRSTFVTSDLLANARAILAAAQAVVASASCVIEQISPPKRIEDALVQLHQVEARRSDLRPQMRGYIAEFERMRNELEDFGTKAAELRSRLLHENGCTGECTGP